MKIIENLKGWYDEQKALNTYGDYYNKKARELRQILFYFKYKKGYNIAIWGAGLKGKAFLHLVDSKNQLIKYVYDINKDIWNTKMYTGHQIVDYQNTLYRDVDVVLIMNNNFETEIAGMLKEANMHVILVNIDSIICGDMTTREALLMYRERL